MEQRNSDIVTVIPQFKLFWDFIVRLFFLLHGLLRHNFADQQLRKFESDVAIDTDNQRSYQSVDTCAGVPVQEEWRIYQLFSQV
jgi:hypothetical protein